MTLEQIKAAVESGKRVFWQHNGYEVVKGSLGQWLIKCHYNGNYIGLTWGDGVTMNGKPDEFFQEFEGVM